MWYLGLWSSLRDGDSSAPVDARLLARFVSLFRNPVTRRELDGDKCHLFVNGPLVCFNIFHMIRELRNRPPATREICLHLSPAVPLIDHTTFEYLQYLEDDLNSRSDRPKLQIDGWDHLRPLTKHETSDSGRPGIHCDPLRYGSNGGGTPRNSGHRLTTNPSILSLERRAATLRSRVLVFRQPGCRIRGTGLRSPSSEMAIACARSQGSGIATSTGAGRASPLLTQWERIERASSNGTPRRRPPSSGK